MGKGGRGRGPTTDERSQVASRASDQTPQIPDTWLKLERSGDTIIGSLSSDASAWIEVGRVELAASPSPLPPRLYGGICAVGLDRGQASFRAVEATLTDLGAVSGSVPPRFRRGDCNDDGAVNISDAVCTLSWLFVGGPAPGCLAIADQNGDAATDISDPVFLLAFLCLGGPPPVAPFPDCTASELPADKDLGCGTTPRSCEE